MKKTTKKTTKASHKKAVKDLGVKPAKGGAVRGGFEYGGIATSVKCVPQDLTLNVIFGKK
jgi:hypothetical protein